MTEKQATAEKYIIMPYRKGKRQLIAGEMRPASSEASAMRIAETMSARFAGVLAYAVQVDTETGDMLNPRLLASYGEIPQSNDD